MCQVRLQNLNKDFSENKFGKLPDQYRPNEVAGRLLGRRG